MSYHAAVEGKVKLQVAKDLANQYPKVVDYDGIRILKFTVERKEPPRSNLWTKLEAKRVL